MSQQNKQMEAVYELLISSQKSLDNAIKHQKYQQKASQVILIKITKLLRGFSRVRVCFQLMEISILFRIITLANLISCSDQSLRQLLIQVVKCSTKLSLKYHTSIKKVLLLSQMVDIRLLLTEKVIMCFLRLSLF